jgi:hypothetical protein
MEFMTLLKRHILECSFSHILIKMLFCKRNIIKMKISLEEVKSRIFEIHGSNIEIIEYNGMLAR